MELVVETLGDVLPHIVPETGIVHIQQDGYSVLNYVFTMDSTFDSQIARECRGLKFDPQGALIARPFHKFFNLGEKRPLEEEPWQTPHVILDKLDGSMVHPAYVRGEMVFMTRMGRSAQANAAFEVAGAGVIAFCTDMIARGYTPIFEYTAPDNRIVLAYENAELTLLAVRHMRSGVYMTQLQMTDAAAPYGVSTVASFGAVSDAPSFGPMLVR